MIRWRAGQRPRLVIDAEGARWSAWFQGPASPAFDLVRFYPASGERIRYGGIAGGTWAKLTEDDLRAALGESFAR